MKTRQDGEIKTGRSKVREWHLGSEDMKRSCDNLANWRWKIIDKGQVMNTEEMIGRKDSEENY